VNVIRHDDTRVKEHPALMIKDDGFENERPRTGWQFEAILRGKRHRIRAEVRLVVR
jgi:hypothetical protein